MFFIGNINCARGAENSNALVLEWEDEVTGLSRTLKKETNNAKSFYTTMQPSDFKRSVNANAWRYYATKSK